MICKVEIVALVKNFKKYQENYFKKYKGKLGLSSSPSHVCFHVSFLGYFTQQCVDFSLRKGKL